jgi:colicin import membrane protein
LFIEDRRNVIPVTLAVLLHVIVFGSLFVVIDFTRRTMPPMPLAIKGTLVTDNAVVIPPPVVEETPEPPPAEPVPSDSERLALEEQKRLEDARIEAERLERIRQQEAEQKRLAAEAERKRKAEEERQRQVEEERRKREAEAEKERQRLEAERRRQEEIERQRAENERLRREAEAARLAEIEAESRQLEAMQANAEAAYIFAIRQQIQRNWVKPPTATAAIECVVNIRQLPGGEVVSVSIGTCNGDSAVRASIESAVRKASPLPAPRDPGVFSRDIRLIFRPEE